MMSAVEPDLTIEAGIPIHRQIREQIRSHIVAGRLAPGEELPTARAVAVGLAVNVRAVVRAYRRLESDGYLTTMDHSGTFVAAPRRSRPRPTARQARMEGLCMRLLARAERSGFLAEEVMSTLQSLTQRRSQS